MTNKIKSQLINYIASRLTNLDIARLNLAITLAYEHHSSFTCEYPSFLDRIQDHISDFCTDNDLDPDKILDRFDLDSEVFAISEAVHKLKDHE